MTSNRFRSLRWTRVFLLALSATLLFAQGTDRGTLVGTVTDPSGAVAPGVAVTVTNMDTGIPQGLTTGAAGYYSFPNLPVGNYQVTAQLSGFKRSVVENVRLEVGAMFRVDITLQVGEVATEISVTAGSTPLLRTENAEVSHVIEQKRVVDLPLNGRDFQQLQLLTPGSVDVFSFQQPRGLAGGADRLATTPSLTVSNGGRPGTQLFLIDGADVTNQHARTILVSPNVDEIQEFRVSGSNFSAEYGYGMNVVNVSTKSGTNAFHGAGWYFNRDDALAARSFFASSVGDLQRNQFGGSIGGPVIRNRAFFFFTYEGQREKAARPLVASVPTALMRTGDLSELGKTIYDPTTSRLNSRSTVVRDPFQNNAIPTSRIHSVPKLFLIDGGWVPLPTEAGIRNNFRNQPNARDDYNSWTVRGDYQLTEQDSLMARYTYRPRDFPFVIGPYDGQTKEPYNPGGIRKDTDGASAVVSWTHAFGPTTFLEARHSMSIGHTAEVNQNVVPGGIDWVQEAGIGGFGPGISDIFPSFPDLQFTGWTGISSMGGFNNAETSKMADAKIAMVRGTHSLKVGGAYRFYRQRVNANGIGSGSFVHDGTFTSCPSDECVSKGGGDGLADFLLGLPFNGTRRIPEGANYPTFQNVWTFFQDDWQIRPNLTLNLGLRYEINLPTVEKYNSLSSFIASARGGRGAIVLADPSVLQSPLADLHPTTALSLSTYQHLLVFADDVGLPRRSFRKTNFHQFAPRIGLAWRVGNDMTVRAGYGIYLLQVDGNIEISTNPPLASREFAHINESDQNGAPLSDITTIIKGNSGFLPTPQLRGQEPFLDGNAGAGQAQQWNLSVQKLLPHGFSLEVGYVGTKADHLQGRRLINDAPAGPGNIQARRPFPDFSRIEWNEFGASSNYHSFQSKLERRFSDGLTVLGAFTWSKSIDNGSHPNHDITNPLDRSLDRGPSEFDIPVSFALSAIYDLPFYRTSAPSPVLKHVLGGWSVASIIRLQSGFPFTPTWSGNISNTGGAAAARPIRVCDGKLSDPTLNRWFDASCFAEPQQFTFGNSGRNILRADGLESIDLAIYKVFEITESQRLQFRAEFFNAVNHPNFGAPASTINAANAATVSSAGPGRIIQFGLKYNF